MWKLLIEFKHQCLDLLCFGNLFKIMVHKTEATLNLHPFQKLDT